MHPPPPTDEKPVPAADASAVRRRAPARHWLARLGRIIVFLLTLGMVFPHAFGDDDD